MNCALLNRSTCLWIALILMAFPTSGCSLFWVEGAPPEATWDELQTPYGCTQTWTMPAVDLAASALAAGAAASFSSGADAQCTTTSSMSAPSCTGDGDERAAAFVLGGAAVALLASGVYGGVKVSGCRDMHTYFNTKPGASSGPTLYPLAPTIHGSGREAPEAEPSESEVGFE